jgi:hypothetical protein
MEFGISTRCFGLTALTVDQLERLRKSGFTRIEIHANRPAFDFHNRALIRAIGRWFEENETPAPGLHLPFEETLSPGITRPLSVAAREARLRQEALDEIKRCLELADRIGLAYAVLHIGVPGQDFHPVVFDYAYAAVASIQAFAGIRVLLENLPNAIATAGHIEEFKAVAQLSNVGFCYDTGHEDQTPRPESGSPVSASRGVIERSSATLEPESATPGAGRLLHDSPPDAIHLNDNHGSADDHLWPFEGAANWHAFVDQLVQSPFKGPLVLEASGDRLDRAQECRRRLGDLIEECRYSPGEFRLKYKLPLPKHEDER